MPSFTVKNPRLQLVKIDHVISFSLSLTDTIVSQKVITYGRVFKNSTHFLYQSKWFLLSFYSSESCPLSEYTIKIFNLAGFLAHVQFFRLLDKFEVWASCEAVCDIIDFI